jgi:tRNA threonylcarbamoyladenosine biosynthesis protein TsaB
MKLLALDTASELCSAALWLDGALLLREAHAPRAHAGLILPMVDALLIEAGMQLTALDAIAFGRGPGAFTGVRLAVAVAQGLGFAAGRPLIGISDLQATAAQVLHEVQDAMAVLVCQDARMDEVYWGCFERAPLQRGAWGVRASGVEGVSAGARVQLPAAWAGAAGLIGAGSGFSAYPELAQRLQQQLTATLPHLQPRAREVAWLAAQEGLAAAVPPEQALPVYLRDQVAGIPSGRSPN